MHKHEEPELPTFHMSKAHIVYFCCTSRETFVLMEQGIFIHHQLKENGNKIHCNSSYEYDLQTHPYLTIYMRLDVEEDVVNLLINFIDSISKTDIIMIPFSQVSIDQYEEVNLFYGLVNENISVTSYVVSKPSVEELVEYHRSHQYGPSIQFTASNFKYSGPQIELKNEQINLAALANTSPSFTRQLWLDTGMSLNKQIY